MDLTVIPSILGYLLSRFSKSDLDPLLSPLSSKLCLTTCMSEFLCLMILALSGMNRYISTYLVFIALLGCSFNLCECKINPSSYRISPNIPVLDSVSWCLPDTGLSNIIFSLECFGDFWYLDSSILGWTNELGLLWASSSWSTRVFFLCKILFCVVSGR